MSDAMATVCVPDTLTDEEYDRLEGLWNLKQRLEKKSLGSEASLYKEDGRICLSGVSMDMIVGAEFYLPALVAYAKQATRVNKPHRDNGANDRYTFRTWLNRIGLKGPEYKTVRKILLRNLTGSSSRAY